MSILYRQENSWTREMLGQCSSGLIPTNAILKTCNNCSRHGISVPWQQNWSTQPVQTRPFLLWQTCMIHTATRKFSCLTMDPHLTRKTWNSLQQNGIRKIPPLHPSANPVETFMRPLGKAMKTAHQNHQSERCINLPSKELQKYPSSCYWSATKCNVVSGWSEVRVPMPIRLSKTSRWCPD